MRKRMDEWKDKPIYDRDGKVKGMATGSTHLCSMEGCMGQRVSVRWPDGKHTFPCSKGLTFDQKLNALRIG